MTVYTCNFHWSFILAFSVHYKILICFELFADEMVKQIYKLGICETIIFRVVGLVGGQNYLLNGLVGNVWAPL